MEQKKIQRIIGIVVVIALVIVVMPLILGKNDMPMESATNMKAPLPDQSTTTVASATDTMSDDASSAAVTVEPINNDANNAAAAATVEPAATLAEPSDAAAPALPKPPALSNTSEAAASSPDKPAPAPGTVIYEPVTSAKPAAAAVTPAVSTEDAAKPMETAAEEDVSTPVATAPSPASSALQIKTKQAVMKEKKSQPKSTVAVQAKKTMPSAKTGWVVQMGNFALKKNATHLADALRAAGYKVFTQDIKNAQGKTHTRVYIGPESKLASATKISNDIYRHTNMKGYVVSYKL